MKVRHKNPILKEMIEDLNQKGVKAPIWKAVARGLNRPKRSEYKVNLYKLQKLSKPGETIVVPGAVLGSGDIDRKLTIGALNFSASARAKIEKAGGACLTIPELAEKNPKGSKVRIIG